MKSKVKVTEFITLIRYKLCMCNIYLNNIKSDNVDVRIVHYFNTVNCDLDQNKVILCDYSTFPYKRTSEVNRSILEYRISISLLSDLIR